MLAKLSTGEHDTLIKAMQTIEGLFSPKPEPKVSYLIRSHRPGDSDRPALTGHARTCFPDS